MCFVCVLFGIKLVPRWIGEAEEAFLSRDPQQAVREDFAQGDLRFLRVWMRTRISEDEWTGNWEVAGKSEIAPTLLSRYPDRRDISLSTRLGMNLRRIDDRRRIRAAAYGYNLKAAELLSANPIPTAPTN